MRKEIIVEDFSGGIVNDIREQSSKGFAISQHFDNTTFPKKLVPFRDSQDDNTTQVGIGNFAWDGTKLYGLGLKTSPLRAQIYQKTGLTGTWGEPSTATSGTVSDLVNNCFVIYKGYTYQFVLTGSLDRWQIGGTYTDGYASLSFNGFTDGSALVTQGIVHSKTDTLYMGYYSTSNGSRIFSDNNGTTQNIALQLPTNVIVTSLAEYGSYLAIGCRPVNGAGNSKVFLWDMVQSDVSEVLDFGVGDLWILANVEGRLVAVMNEASSSDITFSKKKVYIKIYAGGSPTLFKSLEDTDLSLLGLLGYKPYYSNINGLTFGLYSTGSRVPTGLYTFSRGAGGQEYQITSSRLIHNNTVITNLVGIYKVGDVVFTSYNYVADTSSNVGRTEESEIYNNTAFIETVKYNCGSINKNKRLVGISVSHEPLSSGQTVSVYYKKDSETTYTLIDSNTAVDSVFKEYISIASTAKNLPEFHEIQFRIESTGGAVITGWRKVYEEKDTLLDNK